MVPYAREKNIRIVRPNLRDSRGSTPFSQPELDVLRSGDKDAQKEFLIQRTTEVAKFLRWFIEKEKIPKISESQGRRVGGISIANWSASGCLATSLLGFGASLPSSTREFLGDYLRSVILYGMYILLFEEVHTSKSPPDPPFAVLGLKPLTIDECYLPFIDPTLSNEEKVNRFPEWVTSYYTHSPSALSSFCIQNYDELPTREEFLEGVTSTGDSEPAPSLLRTSTEILKEVGDPEGVFRSHNPMLFINSEIRAEAFEKALFDDETTSKVFPNVEVPVVVCRQSTGVCMYSAWEIHRRILKHRREKGGPTVRPLSMRFWARMNHAVSRVHFSHWPLFLMSE